MRCSKHIGGLLQRRPWYQPPRFLAYGKLVEIRNELREKNLHDTEEPPLEKQAVPPPADLDPAIREARTTDGTSNDFSSRRMGAVGCRFGRNVPLQHTVPDTANLLVPNPRTVSRELMTREQFQPATILNLLAAAWIQFMVHDWFVHKRSKTEFLEVPTGPGDDFGALRVPRSVPEPHRPVRRVRRPTRTSTATGGMRRRSMDATRDGRQAAHAVQRQAAHRAHRTAAGRSRHRGALLRLHRQLVDRPGDAAHALHPRAQLHLRPARAPHPDWTDEQLFRKAKLINSALMAKIHTIEWTPAIVPNPIIATAMNVNWSGLAGEDLQDAPHSSTTRSCSAASSAHTPTITPHRIR